MIKLAMKYFLSVVFSILILILIGIITFLINPHGLYGNVFSNIRIFKTFLVFLAGITAICHINILTFWKSDNIYSKVFINLIKIIVILIFFTVIVFLLYFLIIIVNYLFSKNQVEITLFQIACSTFSLIVILYYNFKLIKMTIPNYLKFFDILKKSLR